MAREFASTGGTAGPRLLGLDSAMFFPCPLGDVERFTGDPIQVMVLYGHHTEDIELADETYS